MAVLKDIVSLFLISFIFYYFFYYTIFKIKIVDVLDKEILIFYKYYKIYLAK